MNHEHINKLVPGNSASTLHFSLMHAANNLSETEREELDGYILKKMAWDTLPDRTKKYFGGSEKVWRQYIYRYSIQHQLRWRTNLVRSIFPQEKNYYEELIKWSREHYMVCN